MQPCLWLAQCSMCSDMLSPYYSQVPLTDWVADCWDDAFWDELERRLLADVAAKMIAGPAIDKSIAPRRSFGTERVRWGNLFLCGDAAPFVPPTGAKGLNLAA